VSHPFVTPMLILPYDCSVDSSCWVNCAESRCHRQNKMLIAYSTVQQYDLLVRRFCIRPRGKLCVLWCQHATIISFYLFAKQNLSNEDEKSNMYLVLSVYFSSDFMKVFRLNGGTRWRSWLRHCATSRKIAGSIPDSVIGIFH
jgi:hypothetical protein